MKNIKILLLSLASSVGAFAADFEVTPGSLGALLVNEGKGQTELKLKGTIDARDLAAFENMPAEVKTLDLREVSIKSLTMPDRTYFGRTLFAEDEIPEYTFFNLGVEALILPENLKTVRDGAFANSKIRTIVVPEGVESLGDYAFYGCSDLKSVSLPVSLSQLGKGAFSNCPDLEEIDLSATGLTRIPAQAFAGAVTLKEVRLPSSVESIGREAFSHTMIETLDLSGVGEFEAYALSGMPYLKSLSINPDAKIGNGLLMDNISLSSLSGVPEFLPDYFAANCGQLPTETAVLSSTLGNYSMANTLAPETLILTPSLESIGRGALSGLNTLQTIDATALESYIPTVDEFSFEGLDQPAIDLQVTAESANQWKGAPYWSLFNIVPLGSAIVDDVAAEICADDILIALRGGNLVVESSGLITDVRIYTADGRIAFVASPDRPRVEIETASLPSGIVMVGASDSNGNSKSASLLLK